VLVFDAATQKWFESSRRVRATRPDQDGQWQIKGLPNGEYLPIALDYVEDGAWNDPSIWTSSSETRKKSRSLKQLQLQPCGENGVRRAEAAIRFRARRLDARATLARGGAVHVRR